MKILKKPKIAPCECRMCGTVFQSKWRNLEMSIRFVKEKVYCPMCKEANYVVFEKGGEG